MSKETQQSKTFRIKKNIILSYEEKILMLSRFLIEWFKTNGRDLPWRHTRDPYKILVSEIMLQQTNVDIVIPIYKAFLRKFPTIEDLSKSQLSQVKEITDKLGYKRRGEYLHEIANQIMGERNGSFPTTYEDLLSLKGIGRYTAGAILSFAYEKQDKTSAIVDVNVERVLSRIFGLYNEKRNSEFESRIWKLSEMLVSAGDIWTINQSILDLGAIICIAQKPKCPVCPMNEICEFYINEVPKHIPLDTFL